MDLFNRYIQRRDFVFVCLIFFFALFFRVLYFKDYVLTQVYPVMSFSDAYFYYLRANDILSGDFFNAKVFLSWPLYSYFLALLLKLSGGSIFSVYHLQLVLGASQCLLVYFIARKIFNEYAGFLAGLICAFYGWFIFYDGLLIYTSLSLFLNSALLLYLLLIQDNPNRKNLFFAGIISGLCAITQGNMILFSFLAIAWLLWQKRMNFRKSLNRFCFFIIGIGIIAGLPMARNYLAEKKIGALSLNTGLNFYLGNNPASNGIFYCPDYFTPNQSDMLRDAAIIARGSLKRRVSNSQASLFWQKKALEFIKNNPRAYLKLLFKKLFYLFDPQEFSCELEFQMLKGIRIFRILLMNLRLILPFAFLGMLLNIKNFKKTALLYIAIAAISVSILVFFVTAKLKIALVPFLAIFAASAGYTLFTALKEKKAVRFCVLVLLAGLLLFLFNRDLLAKNQAARPGRSERTGGNTYNVYFVRAQFYEEKGDYKNALEEMAIAERLKPNDRFTALGFGELYYKLKDFDRAEVYFKRAAQFFPYYVEAYYNLGFLYNQEGRFAEAEAILNKAVLLDPEDPGCRFQLGKTYKEKGDSERAREQFELALHYLAAWHTQDREMVRQELDSLK